MLALGVLVVIVLVALIASGIALGGQLLLAALIALAIALAVVGAILVTRNIQQSPWDKWPAREIGSSLLTGSLISPALFILQVHLDQEARVEQFKLTVGVTRHLEGLDPDHSLEGTHLSHKVLDYARLEGEDLSDANLQGASLRQANLMDANLRGANLLDADLTGADLRGADFEGADLRAATLREARLFGESEDGEPIDLTHAQVDSRTCWPEDFLASHTFTEHRAEMDPQDTIIHGQVHQDASLGHACVTTPDNIVEVAPPSSRGRGEVKRKGAGVPEIVSRLCHGAREIVVRLGEWRKVYSLLLVTPPDRELRSARILVLSGLPGALGGRVRLDAPLEVGATVALVGGEAKRGRPWPDYRFERRVARCGRGAR